MKNGDRRKSMEPNGDDVAAELEEVRLAALRAWIVSDTGGGHFREPAAAQAYQQMGSFLLARLCDRFERVCEVRAFARQIVRAIDEDMRHGAEPEVGLAAIAFWRAVLERLDG